MSTPLPTGISVDLQPTQTLNPAVEIASGICAEGCSDAVFKDVLADEHLLTEVVANLKQLLSEEEFARIEEMLESGNGLPLAAIFSPDSELFAQISAITPQIEKLSGQMTSSLAGLSDLIANRVKDALPRVMEAPGRQISEAINTGGDRSGGVGKHVQELLSSVKSELPITDLIPKAVLPLTVGGDTAVTSIPNINSAISGLAQLSSIQASGTTPPPPVITAPLGEQGWGEAMGQRIMWMMGKGVQSASIRITPPHLGPIQVQLSVQNDQASVSMIAQHGVVKEALEAAMPRLREMLAESNLQLVNVDVSHREHAQHGSRSELSDQDQTGRDSHFLAEQGEEALLEDEVARHYISSGLLDDYA
ncbi:MAG: hypothetical protein GY814_01470 [Gammaproteobacteria bacterium]|nr:hypothetical protein [Gammaproteobacteria bacterium]